MKGIPPEIDALMWSLAEDGGPIAQEEFERRHARYGPELTRRIRMVAELRAAGKTTVHRPSFAPRPVRAVATPRWAVATVTGMAVLAVGAVAFVAASGGERPKPVPPAPAPKFVPKVDTTPVVVPSPEIVHKVPVAPPIVAHEDPKPNEKPKYLEPRDVHLADTDLTSAIQLVATGGGLKATLAPGFEDKKVSLDYEGLSTLDTLKAMGEEYGFSVLEEGEGEVLIVPVRETTDPARRVGI